MIETVWLQNVNANAKKNENSENESYQIQINPMDGIGQIISKTVWGMVRAMETFSQLIYVDSNHPNCSRMIIDVIQVWDRPRFRYRSIMIDTARHYLPLWIILQNLVIIMNLDNIITY